MYYKNPTNLKASVKRFFDEYAADADKGAQLGVRAQQVQQSGTPNVWDTLAPMANQARKRFSGVPDGGGRGGSAHVRPRSETRTTTEVVEPGQSFAAERSALKRSLPSILGEKGLNASALLDYKGQMSQLGDVAPVTRKTTKTTRRAGGPGKQPDYVGAAAATAMNPKLANTAGRSPIDILRIAHKADRLNNKGKLPYLYGGGHGLTPAKVGELVDCSGFVSQLLGVKPRTSGIFAESWGKPGKGKFATVWAGPGHVIMSVRDPRSGKLRWFGTSGSNKGGGAGEIDANTAHASISSMGLVPRHPGKRGKRRRR